jgi:hypothetical protein
MTIFRKKGKREAEGQRLVGAYLLPRVHNYMTLYVLAKRTTKTKIIQTLIENWMGQQIIKEPEEVLIDNIIEQAKMHWKVEKTTNPKVNFVDYKERLEKELAELGLKENYIRTISTQI